MVLQVDQKQAKGIVRTVFIALVLDLLAFTIPLPLFPRLIAWYTDREQNDPSTLLATSLSFFKRVRTHLVPNEPAVLALERKNWDIVLLGGALGSIFSLCQCLVSPHLGALSDRYGRKRVLMASMLGNLVSAFIWMQSTSFASFLLARLVGGLSEGNVQISTAIISDVTTPFTRSKSLALIGIAFSICFTFGPSLGAYFASRPVPGGQALASKWNIYALPALISIALLGFETMYLGWSLPETKGAVKMQDAGAKMGEATGLVEKEKVEDAEERRKRLKAVGLLHGCFLLFFSGAEFTLTFLTYDLFGASNRQNGMLLSFIGVLSSLLQGGHVRPSLAKLGELTVSRRGIISCTLALSLLAYLPSASASLSQLVLYHAAAFLAYTSATVVTGLTASAASCCDEASRGRELGAFRSKGQLGRAIGPLLATSVYWLYGPMVCYATAAGSMAVIAAAMSPLVRREVKRKSLKVE